MLTFGKSAEWNEVDGVEISDWMTHGDASSTML